ncbi:pentatricopeptide repeat-containing protein At4g16390, chloroplastic-like [Vicia villosa]|uniref:pentatricopeptide repeat-containing protein At4g16390, chloroplastic-like n=1 Tax=Vicia villosa TaxID=3911 RepID=UPI00273C548D|nr:pentatricopeptide repeat-containing protein At4g16390, chloroplastic-like [Vicia villosa]
MVHAYPLCSSPSSTFSDFTTRISSPNSFANPKFPNFNKKSRKFKIFLSFQPPNSLEDANHNDPHANSSTLSKSKIWVNPKILSSGRVWSKTQHAISSLAKLDKSFDPSDPIEQQVSEILKCLGNNAAERDAEHVLHNIANPEIAILALEYFKKKLEPERHVVLYNVLLKLFREIKDFEKAEKVFEEMLQRGVKPNVVTFSTLIRCASLCSLPHKSVELFERMPSFRCEPDHNVSSSMIYVYARMGNVDMALKLYDDAKNEKWPVRTVAFSALIKMHGVLGNYDECLSVYKDLKALGVRPHLTLYNALLYAMAKAKRPRDAQGLYEEMKMNGILPNWATYSALLEAYSRGRLSKEALRVYKEMKEKEMKMNKFLYGMLIDMCADVGCVDEAEEIFEDMKRSETCEPNLIVYSSLINMYSCIGKVLEAEAMLNEMISHGFELNIFVLTMFVHCYGKARRTDDVVNIFNKIWETGITPDDRFWDCLLNVMIELPKEELGKITNCIEKTNPKLGYIVTYLTEGGEEDGYFIKETSELLSSAKDDVKKSLCNNLLDLCVNLGVQDRARDILDLGLTLKIYSDIQSRSETQWCLNLKKLSVGAAMTAFHVWIDDLSKAFESGEELPQILGICTVPWRHRRSEKDLASVFESYLKEHSAPFHKATNMDGWFLTTSQDAKSWLQSRGSIDRVVIG